MRVKLFIPFIVSIFFTASFVKAEMASINQAPNANLSMGVIKQQDQQGVSNPNFDVKLIQPKQIKKRFWNLEKEDLYAEEQRSKAGSARPSIRKLINDNNVNHNYSEFLNQVSPGYKLNRNFLSLVNTPVARHKRSIMFVFLMNKPKPQDTQNVAQISPRSRMHVMGPKKVFLDQKVIDDEYPIDLTVGKYEDGYSAGEWNLVLPNKKPKEVDVSFMWSF